MSFLINKSGGLSKLTDSGACGFRGDIQNYCMYRIGFGLISFVLDNFRLIFTGYFAQD